jgi:hypothetical protein
MNLLSRLVQLFGHGNLKSSYQQGIYIHASGGIQTYYPSDQVAKTHALRRAVTAGVVWNWIKFIGLTAAAVVGDVSCY